jgi:NADPH:quinone reductase-like Zn-dependent oxidoreductase
VGTLVIQLAKQLGAFVATTTSAENADLVKSPCAISKKEVKSSRFQVLQIRVLLNPKVIFLLSRKVLNKALKEGKDEQKGKLS